MGSESDDPSVIRSLAISTEDLVAALESTQRSGRDAVLRVTPPFSGRMRARLHVTGDDQYDDPAPVHVDPTTLIAASAPDYPTPAQTEDELRADPTETYSRERHHDRHAAAVDEWRASIGSHVVDTARLDTPSGPHEIDVTLLG